jgi:hypothetical protein
MFRMRDLVEGLVFFEKLMEDLLELIDWLDQRQYFSRQKCMLFASF